MCQCGSEWEDEEEVMEKRSAGLLGNSARLGHDHPLVQNVIIKEGSCGNPKGLQAPIRKRNNKGG